MENLKATSVQAKTISLNFQRECSIKAIEHYLKEFEPYLNSDITKIDHSFLAKVKINELSIKEQKKTVFGFDFYFTQVHFYFDNSRDRLCLNVSSCVTGGGKDKHGVNAYCNYERNSYNIGDIENHKLTALYDSSRFDYLREKINLSKVLKQAEKVEKAKEQYKKEVDKIPYELRQTLYIKPLY